MSHPAEPPAEVIATFGRHLLIRDSLHAARLARPQGRTLDIVCGDHVRYETRGGEELIAVEVLPRRTALRRSNQRGRSEAIVANLSQLVVVIAPVPVPDFFMVDRYLCAAACAGLGALVVLNKSDLLPPQDCIQSLAVFERLGYPTYLVSSKDSASLDELRAGLANQTAALVGQSGVGKSSLIRQLASNANDAVVGELMRIEEGRHTTTASRLYDCPGGARIIDSPGVRDYAPAIDDLNSPSLGFIEIDSRASACRFQDCRHMQEPHCAVRAAVDSGAVDARRYESYRRLRRLYEELWEKRPPTEQARPRRLT
jgi:ribosome biogenesis GTPase / thiamine phosphate phosphatase